MVKNDNELHVYPYDSIFI